MGGGEQAIVTVQGHNVVGRDPLAVFRSRPGSRFPNIMWLTFPLPQWVVVRLQLLISYCLTTCDSLR